VHSALRGESRLGATYRQAVLQQLCRERAEQRARLAPFLTLSRREAAVLALMMDGHSAETIAATCFVSLPTVRSQIRAILTKLDVKSQLAAVARAYRAGWTPDANQRH
jgi:DNA-binding NarL/FixJ family response regulator